MVRPTQLETESFRGWEKSIVVSGLGKIQTANRTTISPHFSSTPYTMAYLKISFPIMEPKSTHE